MPVTKHDKNGYSKIQKAEDGAARSKSFTARNWSAPTKSALRAKPAKASRGKGWDDILYRIANFSFTVSGMAFQDAWNFDVERVQECCIHVALPDGRLMPFCAYNLTDCEGNYLHRKL